MSMEEMKNTKFSKSLKNDIVIWSFYHLVIFNMIFCFTKKILRCVFYHTVSSKALELSSLFSLGPAAGLENP